MAQSKQRILIINPNTTEAMTEALKPILANLQMSTEIEYFTAPEGVPSVNDLKDAQTSADACMKHIPSYISQHDVFLVACYSPHPLVADIRKALADASDASKPVTGIFEASVATCIAALTPGQKFGIVSTGSQWQGILDDGVAVILGSEGTRSSRYAGTETTGLNADELHRTPKDELARLMKAATKRLLDRGSEAICLGCAGMAGLDSLVREACIETLGEKKGSSIRIVDGVVSGALHLEAELRALS